MDRPRIEAGVKRMVHAVLPPMRWPEFPGSGQPRPGDTRSDVQKKEGICPQADRSLSHMMKHEG
jgi:hypothetical protein